MDLDTAREHAFELMDSHGLIRQGWTFQFDRAKNRLGLCSSFRKRITISKYFTGAANEDEFQQAMLHEIAHALLPAEAGHSMAWRIKAKEIGYRGKRLADNPYSRQRRKEEAERLASEVERLHRQAAVAGSSVVPPPQQIPTVGDILTLPNGRRIKVVQSNRLLTRAVALEGGDREWILSSDVAYTLIER